jgi:cytochrome c553
MIATSSMGLRPATSAGALLFALAILAVQAGEAPPEKLSFTSDVGPAIQHWCGDCHGDQKHKGGVNFTKYGSLDDVQRAADRWEDVLRVLREGEMPPKTADQPPVELREKLAGWVDYALDSIDPAKQVRDPGHVVLHRLSRLEYNNTVRDLLGVDLRPADKFPADGGGGGGFDNNADTLFIPPLLLEKLLDAANTVLDAAKPDRLALVKPADDKPKTRREAAKTTATAFAKRAYRRPVSPSEVEHLLKVFDYCEKKSIPYEDGVRQMLKAALLSPSFLYRAEEAKPVPGAYALSPYEIASRLSYFLWSTMPDEELFALAESRKLSDPEVIGQQVARMLKDEKAKALPLNFTTQWLQLEILRTNGPDPTRFPAFTPALCEAMIGEPVAFMAGLVNDNRSILDLLESDYTYVNGELARHYGIDGVDGAQFKRVQLTDAKRGGVLGMSAVLTSTSHPLRTSPVVRGKWILSQILNAPPPPPPPNVPLLPKDEGAKDELSLRKRLEKHRTDPVCASCHARIDPLGFGLENFDVLGLWRDKDVRGEAIDASGTLPSGESFTGPIELRKVLLKRKEQFARVFTEKLLAYALGRGVEAYDRPVVKEIIAAVTKDGYKMDTLITAIAISYPFRYSRNQPIAAQEPSK